MTSNKNVNFAGLNLSPEDIQRLKAGENLSGSLSAGLESPTVVTPSVQHQLRGHGKDIRPNIQGNRPNEKLVNNVSPDFAGRLAKDAQEFAAAEYKRLTEEEKNRDSLSNRALRRDVEALRRQIKRMEKQLKELTDAKAS
jgi:hypothetical protein